MNSPPTAPSPIGRSVRMKPTHARYLVLGGLCAAASLAYFVRNGVGHRR